MKTMYVQGAPSRWGWFVTGEIASRQGEQRRSNDTHELLLYASCTWYEVRQCVLDRCIGRENVVVLSSTVLQPQIHRGYWYKKLGKHGCRCIALLLLWCCLLFVFFATFFFSFTRQIHKEIGSTVIRRFVNQELAKGGKLSAQGVAFLANIQSRLNMDQDVRCSHPFALLWYGVS